MHKVGRKRRGENHKEVEERERRHISLVFVKIHVVIFPMMRHLYRIFFSTSLWDFVNRVHSWKRSWVWRRWQSQTHYNTHQDFPNGSFKMSGSQSVGISNKTVPFLRMCVWKKSDVQKFRGMYALTFLGMLLRNAAHSTKFHQPYAPINFAHKRF